MNGTLVFIKDASGTNSTTKSNTSNVLGNGFYYYIAIGKNEGTWDNVGSTYNGNVDNGVSFTTDASIVKPLSKVNIIKYAARAAGDWIETSIIYDMSILSAVLLGAEMNFTSTELGEIPSISASRGADNKWHIHADFVGYSTKDNRNGTWVFYVMVTPKGTINYYETITSEEAKNTHSIALPNGFK